ncbi:hypothetical protein [Microbacterium jejuense]|uniref:hypothetical protein n=1 Tax=Microbacterium jejuense TaxID=1263637 RepID=UPI0031E6C689
MSTPSDPTDPPHDELRALRARAYGPDADIHDDPAALARLQQLEAQGREPEPAAADDPSPFAVFEDTVDAADPTAPEPEPHPLEAYLADTDPAFAGGATDAPAAPEDGIPSSEPAEQDAEPAAKPWFRRTPALWIMSLVAAVLLGVGLTLTVQSVTSGKVATLSVDKDGTWPSTFGDRPAGGVLFDEFHGLSVVSFPQGFGLDPSEICMYVVASTAEEGGTVGSVSCGSGPFPATAALAVTEESPRNLRDAFAVGTALQFVLEGEQVHIYAKAPVTGRPSSTPTP